MARTNGSTVPRDDIFFMKAAVREGKKSIEKGRGLPFGAVVVKNDQIIGRGQDKTIASPRVTSHSVLQAIDNAQKFLGANNIAGSTIYATAELCPMCYGACINAGIEKIVYSNVDPSLIGCNYKEQRLGNVKVPEYSIDNYDSKVLIFEYMKNKNMLN